MEIFFVAACFSKMRILKLDDRPTNTFFGVVNQMFGKSSQVVTTTEYCFIVSTVNNNLITGTTSSAVVESWEEPLNIWLTGVENAFVGWALNFRVRMLLKGTIKWKTCKELLILCDIVKIVHSILIEIVEWSQIKSCVIVLRFSWKFCPQDETADRRSTVCPWKTKPTEQGIYSQCGSGSRKRRKLSLTEPPFSDYSSLQSL